MRELGKTPENQTSTILTGVVESVSPLSIKIGNNTYSESFLILGSMCKETYSQETPRIKLWRGLRSGDNVLILRVGRGQLFYVIQRVEGLEVDTTDS